MTASYQALRRSYLGEEISEEPRMWRFQCPDLEVATLHPLNALPAVPQAASPSGAAFDSLVPEVQKFHSDPTCRWVTITIKFTDDGFSLSRGSNGATEAHFSTHPMLDITEEEKVLAFFLRMDICPHVNYLADKGRTRVLQFAMPGNWESIVAACTGLLTDVYAVRSDDVLVNSAHLDSASSNGSARRLTSSG